jgi:hypothetical protein
VNLKNLVIQIEEEIVNAEANGEKVDVEKIARKLNVPVEWVETQYEEIMK